MYDKAQATNEAEAAKYGPEAYTLGKQDGGTIAEQAQALLQGKEKWRPTWMDYGPSREVETDVDINIPSTRPTKESEVVR